MKKIISLLLSVFIALAVCGCSSGGTVLSSDSDIVIETVTSIIVESVNQSSDNTNNSVTIGDENTTGSTGENTSNVSSDASSDTSSVDPNASAAPLVTIWARVTDNVYIVGGLCSTSTEYITIGGAGVSKLQITPTAGKENNYFITQVKIDFNTIIEVQGKENGKNLSNKVNYFVTTGFSGKNLMTQHDYRPVFGLDNRMHYYSSILSYTLSNKVSDSIKQAGKNNIQNTVNAAKNVGAEVVYLVVPSSAAVYPETLPDEYKAASGESIYKAFENVATSCGAKVIYPLDTMKSHKNDGKGYKIYSHTDSHWTTYGAYWGVNELMGYVSSKYPSAAPRSVKEMKFYTTELYAGDAMFSFDDNNGFENYSQVASNGGETKRTRMMELTTLYKRKMPTDTLSQITRNKTSVYLTKDNEMAKTETNPNSTGLPTAVVVRDSFGRTAYDMINDRFSKVTWLSEGDYTSVINAINANTPNYVIYVVSERNLVKVMLENKDISLISLK